MAIVLRDVLKTYFETNDIPTQAEFIDLIDSLLHNSDKNVANGVAVLDANIKLLPAQLPTIPDANISATFLKAIGQLITEINLQGGNVSDASKSKLILNATSALFGFGANRINTTAALIEFIFNNVAVIKCDGTNLFFGDSVVTKSFLKILLASGETRFTSFDGQGIKYESNYSAGFQSRSLVDKAFVESAIGTALVGLIDDRGNYNAFPNLFPSTGGSGTGGAILKGDLWLISFPGTLGGNPVTPGDAIRALVDAPGQSAANWAISENNLTYTPENNINKDTDVFFLANSNIKYPSQAAVKFYVDNESPIRETLTFGHLAFNPADATTYYFGMVGTEAPTTNPNLRSVKVFAQSVIEAVTINWKATSGNQPQNVQFTIRVNNATDYLISNANYDADSGAFNNNSLNIPLNAGDTYQIKFITPTWAPNPTAVTHLAKVRLKLV